MPVLGANLNPFYTGRPRVDPSPVVTLTFGYFAKVDLNRGVRQKRRINLLSGYRGARTRPRRPISLADRIEPVHVGLEKGVRLDAFGVTVNIERKIGFHDFHRQNDEKGEIMSETIATSLHFNLCLLNE